MKIFLQLFFAQALAYFLITANQRALVFRLYFWTFATDMLLASINFFIIRRVAKADGGKALLGYVLGGCCGSMLGILCSTLVYGR